MPFFESVFSTPRIESGGGVGEAQGRPLEGHFAAYPSNDTTPTRILEDFRAFSGDCALLPGKWFGDTRPKHAFSANVYVFKSSGKGRSA
jgi:hypothetical protein